MAHPRKPRVHDSTNGAVPGGWSDKDASDNPIDPRVFGLAKAAYGVGETLDLLSIGRTSLYAAVKRGDLKRVKFGKKTLFYATDLASFITRLRRFSETNAQRLGREANGIERYGARLRQQFHWIRFRQCGLGPGAAS
jgi:hypothetical protein